MVTGMRLYDWYWQFNVLLIVWNIIIPGLVIPPNFLKLLWCHRHCISVSMNTNRRWVIIIFTKDCTGWSFFDSTNLRGRQSLSLSMPNGTVELLFFPDSSFFPSRSHYRSHKYYSLINYYLLNVLFLTRLYNLVLYDNL